jgi:hypothetical protein
VDILARHATDPEATAHALKAVRDFVSLAEKKKCETGRFLHGGGGVPT